MGLHQLDALQPATLEIREVEAIVEGQHRAAAAPQRQRANMVLARAAGATNSAAARRFATTDATVGKWRQRFVARRIEGLHDELRPGKRARSTTSASRRFSTRHCTPGPRMAPPHWSVRDWAAETGIAKTSVHRLLQAFGLQPHRRDSFKLSSDPFFIEKLRDVVGLYLNPPDKARVLCLDEKTRSRRSSAPSRCCRWASATSRA
jgi:putative transposase